ncbi:MAG: hypothetical protein E7376_00680 [Clostridiales bacterium]|nr:hypothetical protein [Clostridiales bacterium]
MRDLSEYKLLGYYLIKLYEKSETCQLKYEQVKTFTQNVFKRLGTNYNYNFLPIDEKINIIKSMISKGMFSTKVVNGKQTFTQKYNHEIAKYIYVTYSADGNLTFKLPREIIEGNKSLLQFAKNIYSNGIDLNLQSAIQSELNTYSTKQPKNKNYA